MLDVEWTTPATYAAHLAGYISDPSTIHIRTREQFGRAPSIEECRKLREKVTAPARSRKGIHTGRFPCGHDRSDENTIWPTLNHDACKQCSEVQKGLNAEAMAKRERTMRERREAIDAERAREIALRRAELAAAERAGRTGPRPLVTDELLADVAYAYGITVSELLGPNRDRRLICARAVVAKVLRDRDVSMPMIAKKLRKVCHSTIRNLLNTWDQRAMQNPHMITVYRRVK